MLSHQTAAELQELADKATNPIHVTVPHERHVLAVEGVSLHRSGRAVDAMEQRSYPPRTRVEETVLDLTQTAKTFDDVCGWVTRAFARDLTDEARLSAAIAARTKLRWRSDLNELIAAAAAGDHSVLEFRYHRDVERAHGLPEPARQVAFTTRDGRRGRRDRVYEPYGLVIELDGRLAHTSPKTRGRTRPGTTPPLRTGSRPCGMAGRRLSGSLARPPSRWPGCYAAVAGAAGPGRARPAAQSSETFPDSTGAEPPDRVP
jgi:hypothetical protein